MPLHVCSEWSVTFVSSCGGSSAVQSTAAVVSSAGRGELMKLTMKWQLTAGSFRTHPSIHYSTSIRIKSLCSGFFLEIKCIKTKQNTQIQTQVNVNHWHHRLLFSTPKFFIGIGVGFWDLGAYMIMLLTGSTCLHQGCKSNTEHWHWHWPLQVYC